MNENATKWVAALKSNEFEQGRFRLRRQDTECYCVMGVACELYRRETGRGEWVDEMFVVEGAPIPQIYAPPDPVVAWLGLKSPTGRLGGDDVSLIYLNDSGTTFKEIAKVILANKRKLFNE